MDWQRYRLPIMAVVALAMVGVTWWAVRSETGDTPAAEQGEPPSLPEVERDALTELEIHRPDDEAPIRLVKEGDSWRLAAPVEAAASSTAVSTALDKLADLEVTGRAASNARHHDQLEVDEESGVRVIARAGDETVLDVWIGALRSGNTMVRVDGEDEVLTVRGSIKFAFNKAVRDWRDRTITDVTAGDVVAVSFQNDNGRFDFRKGDDGWAQVPPDEAPEGVELAEPIEGFDGSKVSSTVSSLARLRAADFAEPDASPESLGFGPDAARVTLTVREGAEEAEEAEGAEGSEESEAAAEGETEAEAGEAAEASEGAADAGATRTLTLLVGAEAEDSQRYVKVEGGDVVYVVSRFMADRLLPEADDFTESAEPPPGQPQPAGMPGGMPGGGPGGGGQLPPELMQQIQRQLQQQGGGHP
jgi:hypothetical protein